METKILKVQKCGEQFYVKSEKAESGQMAKRNLVMQELGGKYENQYVVSALGNLAMCQFYEGDVVIATLRFTAHEYQGQTFQDIIVTDLIKVS